MSRQLVVVSVRVVPPALVQVDGGLYLDGRCTYRQTQLTDSTPTTEPFECRLRKLWCRK